MPGVILFGCMLQITMAPTKTQIPWKLLFLMLTQLLTLSHVEADPPMIRWNLIHPRIPPAETPTSGPSPGMVRWSSSSRPNPSLLHYKKKHRKHLAMAMISPLRSPDYRSLVASTDPSLMLKKSPTPSPLIIRSPSFAASPPGFSDGSISPTPAEPPVNPPANGCCKPNMVLKRDSTDICNCVYPINVELFLQNVSLTTEDWPDKFLKQLSEQLALRVSQFVIGNFYVVGQSGFNITMDITPHKGLSFSYKQVRTVNHSLYNHAVHIDPALVGDYRVISLTWFKPLASSLVAAPAVASSPRSSSPISPPKHKASREIMSKKHSNIILIVVICIVVVVIVITLMLVFCYVTSLRREKATALNLMKARSIGAVEGSFHHPGCTRFIAYEELREATNNFDPSSVLGAGGFGRVFKGVLSDGTAVAIKKLTLGGQQGDKEFLVEVEMLSRLHHRNLVKLIGYFSNHESPQNLLCYELVPNGSLENWLHGPLGANCPLDWDTRMKIALDAARGLAYLHEDSQPCVIHRDFKASNILLENDFHAKVADFGLAKQAPEGRGNHISTRVMGTFGYVAPEYAMTGHLLVKSDVYSYGVVLLELLTGKKPVDMSQASGQENLVNWARPILRDKERLDDLVDPRIVGKYPENDCLRVCTVAAACVAPEASQRPTMGEVVQSLKMVQRTTEIQEPNTLSSITRSNTRPSSTINDDNATATSTFFSGPFSSLSLTDNDNLSRNAMFSEDLREGR